MIGINIDFSTKSGMMKPLHGINNGPVTYGSMIDVSHYYKELHIPYVRIHDPNWPHPREADIYCVFPDFGKDPGDPSSYDFSRTDDYIKSIADTGAGIIYRLGVSIEHTKKKYYTHPPADFDKWAQICLGIIRHYNAGWAGGFEYGIKYWEIWNEPDNPAEGCMWMGTPGQYFELYKKAATAIKSEFPDVKVGGFAATMVNPGFTDMFLAFCKEYALPLDFFSWHLYASDTKQITDHAVHVRELLDRNGFKKTESHLNEWNYMNYENVDGEKTSKAGGEYERRKVFGKSKNEEGASFDASVLMLLQDLPVDMTNYYDGQPTSIYCGLFDQYGAPLKPFYAFKAFNELCRHPQKVKVEICGGSDGNSGNGGLYCCAGINANKSESVILISYVNTESAELSIRADNLPGSGKCICERYILDREHDLRLMASDAACRSDFSLKAVIGGRSVMMVKILL